MKEKISLLKSEILDFRHAYDSDIKEEKFSIIAESLKMLRAVIGKDIEKFVRFLDQLKDA